MVTIIKKINAFLVVLMIGVILYVGAILIERQNIWSESFCAEKSGIQPVKVCDPSPIFGCTYYDSEIDCDRVNANSSYRISAII